MAPKLMPNMLGVLGAMLVLVLELMVVLVLAGTAQLAQAILIQMPSAGECVSFVMAVGTEANSAGRSPKMIMKPPNLLKQRPKLKKRSSKGRRKLKLKPKEKTD